MARTQSKCGALTTKRTRCQRLALVGASRCDIHCGPWSREAAGWRKTKPKSGKGRKRGKK
ncbi:hypothetical protein ACIGW3_16060 [Streptomyces sp. NPDC053499]|uniref:hypothetical protein n=1 Tax=Streptomyces sp. NPDC053499 TaxID=3365707 RepID=UPI0037D07E6D